VRTVDGGLLNLGRLLVLVDDVPLVVDDVPLVVDRREVTCGGQDLLGGAGRDDHPVRDRVIVRGIGIGWG